MYVCMYVSMYVCMYTDLFHRPMCSHLTTIHSLYPASFFKYHQFNITKIPRSAHTVYLCDLY